MEILQNGTIEYFIFVKEKLICRRLGVLNSRNTVSIILEIKLKKISV